MTVTALSIPDRIAALDWVAMAKELDDFGCFG